MATTFNKRLFGTDLDPEIKNKLRARQILAKHSVIPGTSSEFVEIDGQEHKISDLIGDVNFGFKNENLSLGELSSKTPFARMWTAVELYWSSPESYGDDYGKITWDKRFTGKSRFDTEWYVKDYGQHDYQAAETKSYEKRVYVVNNHHLNTFQSNNASPNESLMMGTDGSVLSRIGAQNSGTPSDIFPNQMSDNKYLKPPAGITNISSKTEGTLGAIKRTTVNFKVWNFNDFDTIYSRYFLRPGALVFIDLGWDTGKLYDPEDLVKSHSNGDTSIYEFLYGNNEKQEKGIVQKSKGDFEVLVGRVVDWSAKATPDGGWDCSIEIVSENEALLDHEVSEQNLMKKKFVHGLAPLVINQGARLLGQNFLRSDWMSSPSSLEESLAYGMKYAKGVFGSPQENRVVISPAARKVGIYFQNTFTAKEAEQMTADFYRSGQSVDLEEGMLESEKADPNLHEVSNIYVSWGFFEDEILNKNLSLGFNQNFEISGKFDSTQSFVHINKELMSRQNLNPFNIRDKRSLKWLYPEFENNYQSYNTIHNKVPDYQDKKSQYPNDSEAIIDNKLNRTPMREIFVNLKVIQEAFDSVNSINEGIKKLLTELNSFSFDIWDLQLTSLSRDNSILTVVDRNMIEDDKKTPEFYDSLFTFKPHDPESIVKDFDLSFTTPKNGLQNMIAIGNTGYNNPIYPLTPDEELNNAIRNVMKEGNQLGTRSYPVINQSNYLNQRDIFGQGEDHTGPRVKDILGGSTYHKALKEQYQQIATAAESTTSDLAEPYKGLDDNIHDFDDIWGDGYYGKGVGLKDENGDRKVGESPEDELDITYEQRGALITRDLEEFFGYKAKTQYLQTGLSSILPIDLTLTLHGISGLAPGDLFKVDWLPKRYRHTVYFQVTGVGQEVSSNTWSTKLETVMRIRLDKKDADLYLQPRQILLSNNFFLDMGMPINFTNYFKNIEPIHWSDGKFVGCTARGAMGIPENQVTVYMNSSWDDTYQQYDTGTLTQRFIQAWIDDAEDKKPIPGSSASYLKIFGWDYNNTDTYDLPITMGEHYYIIICFQGAIAFSMTEANDRWGQMHPNWTPPSNKEIFNYVTRFWNGIDKDWKKDYEDGKYQYAGGGFLTPQ